MRKFILLFSLLTIYSVSHSQTLRSVLFNPPGTDNGKEFFEITGSANLSLNNLYFIEIEGDANAGRINTVKNLSAYNLGSNGLLLWRDGGTIIQPGPDAATTVVINDFSPDLQNGTGTFAIVEGFTGAVGDDIDTDNDGTPNASLPWTSVIHAVSVKASSGSTTYYADDFGGQVIVSPVGRMFVYFNNNQWFFDDVSGDFSGMFVTTGSNNGRQLTPGKTESVLPVQLIKFQAKPNLNTVEITWTTLSELNNSLFMLERSNDGYSFETIDNIPGAGTSLTITNYRSIDYSPLNGTNYYRLKQVDHDGAFEYSPIRTVVIGTTHDINVIPTVTSSSFRIEFGKSLKTEATINLISVGTGQSVYQMNVPSDTDSQIIPVDNLPSGTYFVRIQNGQEVVSKMFVKVD